MSGKAVRLILAAGWVLGALSVWAGPGAADSSAPPYLPDEPLTLGSAVGGSTEMAGSVAGDTTFGDLGALDDELALGLLDAPFAENRQAPADVSEPSGAMKHVQLAGPPASILLLLQGLLVIGFARGRRRWAAVLLAALSMGRAGIAAIPRLVKLDSARQDVPAEVAARPALPERELGNAPGDPAELEFIGLLRRLQAAPASDANAVLRIVSRSRAVAGQLRPATAFAFSHAAALPVDAQPSLNPISTFLGSQRPTRPHLLQALAFALFARPPPARA